MSQQQTGAHRKVSDSICAEAYSNSLKCLDKNKYDKSKCKEAFDAYRKCKREEYEADRAERLAKRKGFFG